MGYANLHSNVNWIKKQIARWAGKRCFGVAMENELAPEFIITNHAKMRMQKRLNYPDKIDMMETVLDAWHRGKEPPESFDKDRGHKPKKHYKKLVYKYHLDYIFIFAIRDRERIWGGQKYLVTVYNWKDR